jgi:hypothetical protein
MARDERRKRGLRMLAEIASEKLVVTHDRALVVWTCRNPTGADKNFQPPKPSAHVGETHSGDDRGRQ